MKRVKKVQNAKLQQEVFETMAKSLALKQHVLSDEEQQQRKLQMHRKTRSMHGQNTSVKIKL